MPGRPWRGDGYGCTRHCASCSSPTAWSASARGCRTSSWSSGRLRRCPLIPLSRRRPHPEGASRAHAMFPGMERRGQAKDRHGRIWTATVLSPDEAEEEDLRFWYEDLTPEERVAAVEDCTLS